MGYMYKYRYTSNHTNGVDLDTKGSRVVGRLSARARLDKPRCPCRQAQHMRVADLAAMQTLTPAPLQPSTSPTTVYYRRTRRIVSDAPP